MSLNNSKIKMILLGDFTEYNLEVNNDVFEVQQTNGISEAIETCFGSIEQSCYFNLIISDFKNKEDSFELLKQFLEYNKRELIVSNNSGYPIFLFLENTNFNKKVLFSYFLENITYLELEPALNISSHNILFCNNTRESIEEKILMEITNYFFQKDFINNNDIRYDASINFLFMGITGCGKSTFINYLLGKKRSFQGVSHNVKTIRALKCSHNLFPICFNDSEGFEVNKTDQKEKIENTLKNNLKEELGNKTHIALYLVEGPLENKRGINYSDVEMLVKLNTYKIHYYLIMTKEPKEDEAFKKSSQRFFKRLIRDLSTDKVNKYFSEKPNIQDLQDIINKLENRTFSMDLLKGSSKSIKNLISQINNDLLLDKEIHNNFIDKAKEITSESYELKINISGEIKMGTNLRQDIKKELITPFFYYKNLNFLDKKAKAQEAIKEARDVSQWRKLFFCYNSKMKSNRKEMFEKIKTIYSCINLKSSLILDNYSEKERTKWFYDEEHTQKLGDKLIDIYEKEYKKIKDIDKIINSCKEYNNSINQFSKYMDQIINMKINDTPIPYDVDLIE